MAEICITVKEYFRADGTKVAEHERCYEEAELSEEQKSRLDALKQRLNQGEAPTEEITQQLDDIPTQQNIPSEEPPQEDELTQEEDQITATDITKRLDEISRGENDGGTFNLDGTLYDQGGLVVPVTSQNFKASEVTEATVDEFLAEHADKIGADNVKVGVFKFPNEDKMSVDLNIVVPNEHRDVALRFGALAGQNSLFDLDTFENIPTGASGDNPIEFTSEQFIEISQALERGELPQTVEGLPNIVGSDNTSNIVEAAILGSQLDEGALQAINQGLNGGPTQPQPIDIDPLDYDVVEGKVVNTTLGVTGSGKNKKIEERLVNGTVEDLRALSIDADGNKIKGKGSEFNSYVGEVKRLATETHIPALNKEGEKLKKAKLEELGVTANSKVGKAITAELKETYGVDRMETFMHGKGFYDYINSDEFKKLPTKEKVAYLENIRDEYKEEVKKNIKLYYNKWEDLPDGEDLRLNAKLWYEGANKIAQDMASRYGVSLEQAAAVLASQSPQKDWFMNIEQANRVLHLTKLNPMLNERTFDLLYDKKIKGLKSDDVGAIPKQFNKNKEALMGLRLLDIKAGLSLNGKVLDESTASELRGIMLAGYDLAHNTQHYNRYEPKGNSAGAFSSNSGELANFGWSSGAIVGDGIDVVIDESNLDSSIGTGNKVRNFYNNIVNPKDDSVTMDTHAIGVALNHSFNADLAGYSGLFSTSAYGGKGIYWDTRDAYKEVAAELGVEPRELQSITWEAIRLVMLDADKPMHREKLNEFYVNGDVEGARNYIRGLKIHRPDWSTQASDTLISQVTRGTIWDGLTVAEILANPNGRDFLKERGYI